MSQSRLRSKPGRNLAAFIILLLLFFTTTAASSNLPRTPYALFLPLILNGDLPPNPVLNGGFEEGNASWYEFSSHGLTLIQEFRIPAHTGAWAARLGGVVIDTAYVEQDILIPEGTSYVHFWFYFESTDICGYDEFRVEFNNYCIYNTFDLCEKYNSTEWIHGVLTMTGHAGESGTLRFKTVNDDIYSSTVSIDDVSILPYGLSGLSTQVTPWLMPPIP